MRIFSPAYLLLLLLLSVTAPAQGGDSLPAVPLMPEDTCKIRVMLLHLNSEKSDFSPVLVNGNTLVFASGRPSQAGVSYTNQMKTEVTDLFCAVKRDSVRFGKVKSFSKIINSKYNEGPFTISADGSMLLFSGNTRADKRHKGTSQGLQIYVSRQLEGNWTRPEATAFCNPEHSNCHPTFSKHATTIIFSADMPGGYGGTDLYYTRLENNAWTGPVNLGPGINSSSNELFPYLTGDSVLYFSSNRSTGVGGLDIYRIPLNEATNAVTPMDYPVNTAYDDFGIWVYPDGSSGYFSSNRPGYGGDDIYYFNNPYPDFSQLPTPPVKTKFCYTFFEENAYQPNDSVSMSYEWDFGTGDKIRAETCKYCFAKPGDYEIKLNVVEKNSGEVFYNQITYTLTVPEPQRLIIACGDNLLTGSEVSVDAIQSGLKGYQLLKYYWSFGDGCYNSGLQARHRYKKKGIYTIELGVTARNEATQKIEWFKTEKKISIID